MKKQVLITFILGFAQSTIAMDVPQGVHAEGYNTTARDIFGSYAEGILTLDQQLYKAAENGNYNEVTRLLNEGANVNTQGDYGESPLAAAAGNGYEEIVKLLLKNHALVDAKDLENATPLMRATTPDIVEILLRAGADINAADRAGRTAVCHAVMRKNFSVMQALLENGANLEIVDYLGYNPIMHAAGSGDGELIMLLLTTPNRKMIIRARAGIKAIQISQKPSKDVLWLLKKSLVTKLVQDQMDRIMRVLIQSSGAIGLTAQDYADSRGHVDLGILLDPNNPQSVARIRHQVEENINRLIFGEPKPRYEPAQGLSQEEVDEIMGGWSTERE